MRALAVTSATRSTLLPDVPTIAEAGLPGFSSVIHYGLAAPAGTPRAIVDRLNKELVATLAGNDLRARLAAEGAVALPGTPERLCRRHRPRGDEVGRAGARAQSQGGVAARLHRIFDKVEGPAGEIEDDYVTFLTERREQLCSFSRQSFPVRAGTTEERDHVPPGITLARGPRVRAAGRRTEYSPPESKVKSKYMNFAEALQAMIERAEAQRHGGENSEANLSH